MGKRRVTIWNDFFSNFPADRIMIKYTSTFLSVGLSGLKKQQKKHVMGNCRQQRLADAPVTAWISTRCCQGGWTGSWQEAGSRLGEGGEKQSTLYPESVKSSGASDYLQPAAIPTGRECWQRKSQTYNIKLTWTIPQFFDSSMKRIRTRWRGYLVKVKLIMARGRK